MHERRRDRGEALRCARRQAAKRRPWAVAFAVAAACILVSGQAAAQDPASSASGGSSTGTAIADLIVLRPIGLVRLGVGFAGFLPAATLGSPGGMDSIEEAWDLFVALPFQSVFVRPLGEL